MRRKLMAWGALLSCEAVFAAVYAGWGAPRLAARHLDLETAWPLLAAVFFSAAILVVFAGGVVRKKAFANALAVLMTLLLLSLLLYGIGLHTECPVCGSSLF